MPIDNISLINTKGDVEGIYVFDIPSIEDEEASITYLLVMYKNGSREIVKLTNYDKFFELVKKYNTDIVKYKSKKYDQFIETIGIYMNNIKEDSSLSSLDNDDINIINHQFENELNKKGNTEILKKINKLKIGR